LNADSSASNAGASTAVDATDEMDFRDLVRKPEKLFGSPSFTLALLFMLGALYLWKMNTVGGMQSPGAADGSSAFVRTSRFGRAPASPVDVLKAAFRPIRSSRGEDSSA